MNLVLGFAPFIIFALLSRLSVAQIAVAPRSAVALRALTSAAKTESAKPSEEAVTVRKSQTALRREMRDATRNQARQTVDRLRKELKLIKSMLANDPRQMARAISRIAKELKAALADYARVARENGESFPAAGMGVDAQLLVLILPEARQDRPPFRRRHRAALRDHRGVGERFGQVGEQRLHRGAVLEPGVGRRRRSIDAFDIGRAGNAEHRIVRGVE